MNEGRHRFNEFLRPDCGQREFTWPTCHPSRPTGFCPCDRGLFARTWFYLRAGLLLAVLRGPWNAPKGALLRAMGARVGKHVYISTDVFIDPLFLPLLTIEDDVMIGLGARIFTHEFGPDRFRAGRVAIRHGAVLGGYCLIGPGVEIGAGALVAAGAVVGRDVPAGHTAIGNPARNVSREGHGDG